MNFSILKLEVESAIGLISICRPKALNALNSLFFKELDQMLSDINTRDDIRAVIITGEGKAFVAGADITEMQGMSKSESYNFSQVGHKSFAAIGNMDIPVIAAVNGFALGGGLELALACDFRIASSYAKFGFPEVGLGLIPGYAGTQRLSRLIGQGNALFMQLSTEMITADEALRMGIVQKVTEADELLPETRNIAKKILRNGPNAIIKLKRTVRDGLDNSFDEAGLVESEAFSTLFESDGIEGMNAFLEKRRPEW